MKNDIDIFDLIIFLILLVIIIGYITNIQNVFEYLENVPILDMSPKWYISLIGIFIPIIGVITGYIW